jgi:Asp-tRNA(Asn)/Glu-tRNA(Gln) amidotransferase A subunit family amidase
MNTKSRAIVIAAVVVLWGGFTRLAAFDLTTATIADIQAAVDAGELTYERLIQMHIERIATYDKRGPAINDVIAVNARALSEARALDAEFKAKGRRSSLHGIPVVVKDIIDQVGMPNSGGTLALRNSFPGSDAFIIRKLRDAGAIILVRANLSEFASGAPGLDGASTLGGQPRNPYNLDRHSDGSSSGTGGALAAVFSTVGLGTETGSSTRGPAYHNNLVGLGPTEGLVSRDGVIPNSMTLDRVGLMGRYVYDVAVMLNYSIGVDYNDQLTRQSIGQLPAKPYESYLSVDGLKGTRIGVFRSVFTSSDPKTKETQQLADAAIKDIQKAGATLLDPANITGDVKALLVTTGIGAAELREGINGYLARLGPDAPIHDLTGLIRNGGIIFNKFASYKTALTSGPIEKYPKYAEMIGHRTELRAQLIKLLEDQKLEAIVYLHNLYPAEYINEPHPYTKVTLSSVSGLPGLVVPAGFTSQNQPVGIEFLGRPFSEPTLLRLAYAYEQATKHRRLPQTTPPLPSDLITKNP